MGKKNLIGVNDIMCVAVLIPMKKLGLPKLNDEEPPKRGMPEINREKVNEIIEVSKKYGGIGATMIKTEYFAILMDSSQWKEKGKDFFDWCYQKEYDPKIADKSCIVDKRYMEGGIYEGVVVDIPPQYIDDAIRNLIKQYCDEIIVTQVLQSGLLMFEGELYPEVKITIMYNKGFIGGGMKHNVAYCSQYPTRDYQRILKEVENQIINWINNHEGVYRHDA